MTAPKPEAPTLPDWKNARSIDQPHFAFWMSALTSEGLHAKADIARLLAMLTQELAEKNERLLVNHADALAGLVRAVAEYEAECANPGVDLMYRANRRKNMFDKLAVLNGAEK